MTDTKRLAALIVALGLLVAVMAGCRGAPGPAEEAGVIEAQEAPAEPVSQRKVLVLCYHAMSPDAEGTFDVPTGDFAEQLKTIHEGGYESVLPSQIADYLEGRADLPEKAVCFGFDDGPESILTESKPLMDQHGYTGAAFLISDSVGGTGQLDWDQVRELEAAGWEIGSHTVSHARPTKIDRAECMEEFRGSKETIAANIDGECAALAYPYGLYDASVMECAREAGYRIAFTIDRGPADWSDDPMRVPRQMVVNGNSLRTLSTWLAQDKLHLEQIDPPIGERVSTTPTITAALADEDVTPGSVEISCDGNPVSCDAGADARTITFSPELREGANNIRLTYYGSPRREVSWLVVAEPN